jgi:hypothetical protein
MRRLHRPVGIQPAFFLRKPLLLHRPRLDHPRPDHGRGFALRPAEPLFVLQAGDFDMDVDPDR